MRTGWHNRKKIATAQRFIFKYVNDFLVVAVVIVKVPYLAGGNARVELVLFLLSLIGNGQDCCDTMHWRSLDRQVIENPR